MTGWTPPALPAQWTWTAELSPCVGRRAELGRLESIWAAVEHAYGSSPSLQATRVQVPARDGGIGHTSKRGQAWHYRADHQGSEPNHYEHSVPVADVRRRLFSWSPVEADVQAATIDETGVATHTDATRKAIVSPTPAPSREHGRLGSGPTRAYKIP